MGDARSKKRFIKIPSQVLSMDVDPEWIGSKVDDVLTDEWIEGFELGWSWIVDLEREIYDLYPYEGDSKFLRVLYDAGYNSGERLGEGILNYFELESKGLKERAYYFDAFLSKIQLVRIEFSKEGDHRALTFVGGTPFARTFKEVVDGVICYHTAGLIAGCTKALFDKDVVVIESRCFARGDDDCEFQIWPDE